MGRFLEAPEYILILSIYALLAEFGTALEELMMYGCNQHNKGKKKHPW